MHSTNHTGLQQHSIGDTYPWSIVCRKDVHQPDGILIPLNGETMEHGPEFPFESWADHGRAHAAAEDWINGRRDYVEGMRELADLGYPE